jgi:hypothetical protein
MMDWASYGVPWGLRLRYWLQWAWLVWFPCVYWLVLYWTRCWKQDLLTVLQLMVISLIPASVL